VSPSSGLDPGISIDQGDGYYSFDLSPTTTGTYTLVIKANLTNHVTRYFTFSLLVTQISTTLTSDSTSSTIAIDQNCTVQLTYQDEMGIGIVGADVELVDTPDGLSLLIDEIGGGVYNVTLIPAVTEATSFQISLRACLTNYQNGTAAFSLFVQVIPTDLFVLEGESEDSILYGDEYQLTLAYVRTDIKLNISTASFDVYTSVGEGLEYTIIQSGEVYLVTLLVDSVGIWDIIITANKTNHITSRLTLELEVNPIDTSLNEISLMETLVFGRTYNFTYSYETNSGTSVNGASIISSGSAASWIFLTEEVTGQYTVSITTEDIGYFEIVLTFSKEGYLSRDTVLGFDVREVSIAVTDIEGLTGLEGSENTLSLRLVDSETGAAVCGAMIAFQIIENHLTDRTDVLLESDTEEGLYFGTYVMPAADSDVKIRIFIYCENHQLEGAAEYLEADATPTMSEMSSFTRTLSQYGPLILLGAVIGVGFTGRRSYQQRKTKENIEALAVKRRFDDVRNMLGVVVLHKDSGVPIYSRMVKSGFDESLISAFITAISQFRDEFDVDQREGEILPISDIIRAIRTRNLICAFITSRAPTKTQEDRLSKYAQAIGIMFDGDFEEVPILVIDDGTKAKFDNIFDEVLDMCLHRTYVIVETKKFPRGPKCLSQVISELEATDGFSLEGMARKIASCGVEEARAYKIIMDAIERKDIILIKSRNRSIPLILR
jgi:hypothetical protein